MPRAKQRTPELRDHVLAVALDLLAQDGAAALTARSLASAAGTSTPAVYELFGDKPGVVRAVFFEGWRRLGAELTALPATADPRGDVDVMVAAYRAFVVGHRVLAEVMLARPFADFAPTRAEQDAGAAVRDAVVGVVERCVGAGDLRGDPVDIAHALIALVQGLAAAENAARLGSTAASVERRWALATGALLDGFAGAGRSGGPGAPRRR